MALSDELKNAMTMCRDMIGTTVDLENASLECLQDIWLMAQEYMREHREDEDDPVDVMWLDRVCCSRRVYGYSMEWEFFQSPALVVLTPTGFVLNPGEARIADPTKGQVRRICHIESGKEFPNEYPDGSPKSPSW